MDGFTKEFANSVQLATCRVAATPRLIFLCGGATSKSGTAPIRSARDYFYRYISKNEADLTQRARLAEDINDWFDGDLFEDLIELEVYLADCSDLTILFVESAGSIAELGVFATSEALRPKTLAILNNTRNTSRTFIADGPVRKMKRYSSNLVLYYDWNGEDFSDPSNLDALNQMSAELVQHVNDRSKASIEEAIRTNSHGHRMFLIADLVNVAGILTQSEISELMAIVGIPISRNDLKKYLTLLTHLELIKTVPYSDNIFYITGSVTSLIKYDFKPGTKLRDLSRIKILIRQSLLKSDEQRARLFRRELSGRMRASKRSV